MTWGRVLLVNFALASAYFALGKLGLAMALPPGYVSAIWPAAGLAFAAAWVWGGVAVAPGILVGSFITNSTLGGAFEPSGVGLAIAFGSAIQAAVGGTWLRRFNPQIAFDTLAEVGRFSLIGATSCLIAASIGNLALLLGGMIGASALPTSFVTWWLGDALGVQIFAPLALMAFVADPGWRRRRWSVGAPLLVAFVICGITYLAVRRVEERELVRAFAELSSPFVSALGSLDPIQGRALAQLAASYEHRGSAPDVEFEALAGEVLAATPGLRTIAWAPPDGAAPRGSALRIAAVVPTNPGVVGLDVLADRSFGETSRRALARDAPAMSATPGGAGDPLAEGALLLAVPVDLARGRGLLVGVLDLAVVDSWLPPEAGIRWELREVVDGPAWPIWRRDGPPLPTFGERTFVDHEGVYTTLEFDLLDRRWEVALGRDHRAVAAGLSSSLLVLVLAYFACGVFAGFLLLVSGDRDRVAALVAARTAELRGEVRARAEAVKSERRRAASLVALNGVVALPEGSLRERLRAALQIGADFLGLETAIVSKISGDVFQVVVSLAAEGVEEGDVFPLGQTICARAWAADAVVFAERADLDREGHPVARGAGVESYIGVPVRVQGERYGTLSFSSTSAARTFDDGDREFIRLLARWVGAAIERDAGVSSLRRAIAAAEGANAAKSRFLAMMSHEIRTPLNGVLGMAQLLMTPGVDEEARRRYVETILRSGQTLMTLLNDILDFSKVEAERLDLQPEVVDPQALIAGVAALFEELAHQKGLGIVVRWLGPSVAVVADPVRLRQMLSNYVHNAIAYSESGTVEIRGELVERDRGDGILELSVRDNGVGVASEIGERVFDPFIRGEGRAITGRAGTGLGLALVRALALAMDGAVGFERCEGGGSRFWLRVRVGVVEAQGAGVGADDEPATTPLPVARTADSPLVLVVEDNLVNREITQAMLAYLGCRSVAAGDGREALALLARLEGPPPRLILMDCQMPVMDGYSATVELRRREREGGRARVPVIALTASAFESDREGCLAAGMDDFLTKPLALEELGAALQRWLGG
ncbi:MAG: response regulator [Myxococcales bacterium]|nr:response regulator [Myxococcales bacterium]